MPTSQKGLIFMKLELYQYVALCRDIPEHNLKHYLQVMQPRAMMDGAKPLVYWMGI
jgi:hypothetical protein